MSPEANPSTASARVPLPAGPEGSPGAASDSDDWSVEGDDPMVPARDRDGAVGDAAAAARPDGGKGSDRGLPPQVLARRALNDEVDRLLHGVTERLTACFGPGRASQSEAKLRLRVHRSGYVMEPEVAGANDAVRACLVGVVSGLRVTQPLGESVTLERTLRVQRRRP